MLSSLRISHKLGILVGVSVLAFIISQALVITTQQTNSDRLSEVQDRLYPALELSTINHGELALMEQQINGAVATGDDQQLEETRTQLKTIDQNLARIAELNPALEEKTQALRAQLDDYYSNATRIATAIIEGTADFSRIGEEAAANAEALEQLRVDLDNMRDQTREQFQFAINNTVQASGKASTFSIAVLILALIVLISLSLVIGRSIARSLDQIINSLKDMASGEGDLTSRIHYSGKDELRELADQFNLFVEKLHKSFGIIKEDVHDLNNVAEQLAGSSKTNLERISSQSQAISSTRHSVDELMRSVEEVAGFASSASDQTHDAAKFARSGQEKVESNVSTIRNLAEEIEKTARLVNQFDEFSARVRGLLDTIRTVAEQTNLLALNAAIEAARAGEHGRGFAVVADEVRGLAVRSHQATEEIQGVISELSELSSSAVHSMETSVGKAREGVEATTESGELLRQIMQSVQQLSELNEQIAAATHEQSATFTEVSSYMTDIHQSAEAVMESTDQLDNISKDIQKVTSGLQSVSGQFRV